MNFTCQLTKNSTTYISIEAMVTLLVVNVGNKERTVGQNRFPSGKIQPLDLVNICHAQQIDRFLKFRQDK